jgi:hypothetical protein
MKKDNDIILKNNLVSCNKCGKITKVSEDYKYQLCIIGSTGHIERIELYYYCKKCGGKK